MPIAIPTPDRASAMTRIRVGSPELGVAPIEQGFLRESANLIAAAFERENIIVSSIAAINQRRTFSPTPGGFDPYELVDPSKPYSFSSNGYKWLAGYENELEAFSDVVSPQHLEHIKGRIDRERKNLQTIVDGGAAGIAASIIAGVLDPTILIPGGIVAKGAKGVSAIKTAASFSGMAAGAVTVQEAILHSSQLTRTKEESVYAVGGASIFAGLIGLAVGRSAGRAGAGVVPKAKFDEVSEAVDEWVPPPDKGHAGLVSPSRRKPVVTKPGDVELEPRPAGVPDLVSKHKKVHTGKPGTVELLPQGRRTPVGELAPPTGRKPVVGKPITLEIAPGVGKAPGAPGLGLVENGRIVITEPSEIKLVPDAPPLPGAPGLGLVAGRVVVTKPSELKIVPDAISIDKTPGLGLSNGRIVVTSVSELPQAIRGKVSGDSDLGTSGLVSGTGPKPVVGKPSELDIAAGSKPRDPSMLTPEDAAKLAESQEVSDAVLRASATSRFLGGLGGSSAKPPTPEAPKGLFGLGWLISAVQPRVALQRSASDTVRSMTNELIEHAVRSGGLKASTAEIEIQRAMSDADLMVRKLMDFELEYRTGGQKTQASDLSPSVIFGRHSEDFNNLLARELRGGDTGNEVVKRAAKSVKEDFLNPLAEQVKSLRLVPDEDLANPNYLRRMWDDAALRAGKDDFIAERVADLEKAAAKTGNRFDAEKAAAQAEMEWRELIKVPRGRIAGSPESRGSLLQRQIDLFDENAFERFLINDIPTLLRSVARHVSSEVAIARRFGLTRALDELEDTRAGIVSEIRNARTLTAAREILKKYNDNIAAAHADSAPILLRAMREGGEDANGHRFLGSPKLAKAIRNAETDAAAIDILKSSQEAMVRRFSGGDMELYLHPTEGLVAQSHKKIIDAAELQSKAAAQKANATFVRELDLTAAARDTLRGMYGTPINPSGGLSRAARMAKQMTHWAVGGLFGISAIGDMGFVTLQHGIARTFGKGLAPMIGNMKKVKVTRQQARRFLGSLEIHNSSIAKSQAAIEELGRPLSKTESVFDTITHGFNIATLMSPWNDMMTDVIVRTAHADIIDNAALATKGKMTKAGRANMEELGLSEAMLERIHKQFMQHGKDIDGQYDVWAPNSAAWTDDAARVAFEDAVIRVRNFSLIKGSRIDRPVIPGVSQTVTDLAFQFMSFGFASTSRLTGRTAQRLSAGEIHLLNGIAMTVAMGATAAYLKGYLSGGTRLERMEQWTTNDWIAASIDQSGLLGIFTTIDQHLATMAGTNGMLNALTGSTARSSRFYTPQDVYGAIMGPAAGKAADVLGLVAGTAGDVIGRDETREQAEARRERRAQEARRLLILQNHWMTARMFDSLASEAAEVLP